MVLDQMVAQIVSALRSSFDACDREVWCRDRTNRTSIVKNALGNLGHELGFEVCAAGYPGADEGEWLYDMSWFTLDHARGGFLLTQPMVLESEWSPNLIMDDDFQKLVQARADVRVWVFAAANADEVREHIDRCREQAQVFTGRTGGDRYVCAGFDWLTRTFVIESFQVE